MVSYCPDKGDIVWLDFDPQMGREQAKRRPAVILSPKSYNSRSGLCVLCPITSKVKGYPFEVQVSVKGKKGVVLADQVKSMDWEKRSSAFIAKAPAATIEDIRQKLLVLI